MENDMNVLDNQSNDNSLQNNIQQGILTPDNSSQVPNNIEPVPMPAEVPVNIESAPMPAQVPANVEPTPINNQIQASIEPATVPTQIQDNIPNEPVTETPTIPQENEVSKEEEGTKTEETTDEEETKKKLKKSRQQKQLIIIGVSVFIILAFSVWYLMSNRKEHVTIYYDPNALLTEKEADNLIKEKVEKIINIYENKGKSSEAKEAVEEVVPEGETEPKEESEEVEVAAPINNTIEEDYVTITNYDTIVKELFTENGIKELESAKFNNKQFVVKEEGTIKLLNKIPDENKFSNSNVSLSMIKIKQSEITAQVTFTTYGLKDDILTYYVMIKEIKLVKKDSNWLVDSFNYVNE